MKNFGGDWTNKKIEILVDYAKAYLVIMNNYPFWKLIYFDGFAGSGIIGKNNEENEIVYGGAKRILEISKPKPFDFYYFVEKDNKTYAELIINTKNEYPDKKIYLVQQDCNIKLKSLAEYLSSERGKSHKVLAYIDPYGMQLNWDSISYLKDNSIDLWILVPSGLGVNRLLKKDGNIRESWYNRLENFLGLSRSEIDNYFYQERSEMTLFGEQSFIEKERDAINKAGILYGERLQEVFKYVSSPFILKNSNNTIMYHFYMASNNKTAVKIANDIIKKHS